MYLCPSLLGVFSEKCFEFRHFAGYVWKSKRALRWEGLVGDYSVI
jgi:hypothetical protein